MSRNVLARKDFVFKCVHWWPTYFSWKLTWCTSSRSIIIVSLDNTIHSEKSTTKFTNLDDPIVFMATIVDWKVHKVFIDKRNSADVFY